MKESKLDAAISSQSAKRIYDLLGKRYDWFGGFDARGARTALELLDLQPGLRLLEVGVGTGKQHARIQTAISPQGMAFGIDISSVMLALTREMCNTPLCQADARYLPFVADSFERIYIAYVLDLLPIADIPHLIEAFLQEPDSRRAFGCRCPHRRSGHPQPRSCGCVEGGLFHQPGKLCRMPAAPALPPGRKSRFRASEPRSCRRIRRS